MTEASPSPGKARRRTALDDIFTKLPQSLRPLAQRVSGLAAAEAVWDVLSPGERQRALAAAEASSQFQSDREAAEREAAEGGEAETSSERTGIFSDRKLAICYRYLGGALGLWRAARQVEASEAVVAVAEEVQLISARKAARLRADTRQVARDKGRPVPSSAPPTEQPSWDRERGCLCLGGRVVRQVRLTSNSRMGPLLDVFERGGWPESVRNPFRNPSQLKDAVKQLNAQMLPGTLRFRVRNGGSRVAWEGTAEPAPTPPPAPPEPPRTHHHRPV